MNTNLTQQKSAPLKKEPTTPASTGSSPRWLRLNQLPGFMWSAIRAMGESVFSPLTKTRLDRIEVIADLGSQGAHTRAEIDKTAHQLRSASDPSRIVEYTSRQMAQLFGGLYQAKAVQFETPDLTYLLVQDAMGSYIYRWPSADTKQIAGRIETASKLFLGKN